MGLKGLINVRTIVMVEKGFSSCDVESDMLSEGLIQTDAELYLRYV